MLPHYLMSWKNKAGSVYLIINTHNEYYDSCGNLHVLTSSEQFHSNHRLNDMGAKHTL